MSRLVHIAASLYDDIIDIVRDEAEMSEVRQELCDAMLHGIWVKRGRGQSCEVVLSEDAAERLADLAAYRVDYWGMAGPGDYKNAAALAAARRLVRKLDGAVTA
jgi:hypothetical protein